MVVRPSSNSNRQSRSSSATSIILPQTFQQPQQPALAARKYMLTIPEPQMPSNQIIQPTEQGQVATKGQQQQSRGQPTSFLVIDDQQAGPSRPLMDFFSPPFNPPSVTLLQVKKVNTTYLDSQNSLGIYLQGCATNALTYCSCFHHVSCNHKPLLLKSLLHSDSSSHQPSFSLPRSQQRANTSSSRTTAVNNLKALLKTTQMFKK